MEAVVIGVTGSMGSGKSTFAGFLAGDTGEHLDADAIANRMLEPGEPGYEPVVEAFGEELLDEEGTIDHAVLADRVFEADERLETLEGIVHPLVSDRIARRLEESDVPFFVLDVPLLYESGADALCDWVVVVTAPPETVVRRLRDQGIPEEEVERRRARQMDETSKVERADQVVENTGGLDELRQRARQLRVRIMDGEIPPSSNS